MGLSTRRRMASITGLQGTLQDLMTVARALLNDAPLLILDEPTTNLDPAAEHELRDEIYPATPGRATLAITHRLVHMERMDEILMLEYRSIVERGTYEKLLKANSSTSGWSRCRIRC